MPAQDRTVMADREGQYSVNFVEAAPRQKLNLEIDIRSGWNFLGIVTTETVVNSPDRR